MYKGGRTMAQETAAQELARYYKKPVEEVAKIYDSYIRLGYAPRLAAAMTESDIISEQRRRH